jgi:hypothetical protein
MYNWTVLYPPLINKPIGADTYFEVTDYLIFKVRKSRLLFKSGESPEGIF